MSATLRWQPDLAEVRCDHGRTMAQAAAGDERAHLEARAIVRHLLGRECACWRALISGANRQAIHDLAHALGAQCTEGK